jgi:hypothetical protein
MSRARLLDFLGSTDRSAPSVRFEKRPSVGLTRNVSRQYKAKLFYGFELFELPFDQNSRYWPYIPGQILLNGDDLRRPWGDGGAIGFSAGRFFRRR